MAKYKTSKYKIAKKKKGELSTAEAALRNVVQGQPHTRKVKKKKALAAAHSSPDSMSGGKNRIKLGDK